MFIGCVNYYRDMWPSRAHILKPLTDRSGLKKRAPIKWTDEMQTAFDKMRLIMAANAFAAYPDCWVRRRYCLAVITKLGEQVAKNTKLE